MEEDWWTERGKKENWNINMESVDRTKKELLMNEKKHNVKKEKKKEREWKLKEKEKGEWKEDIMKKEEKKVTKNKNWIQKEKGEWKEAQRKERRVKGDRRMKTEGKRKKMNEKKDIMK